jgi:hypothetical protein
MMVDGVGRKVLLHIRRLYCAKCKRLHHELPDCVVPYKRHCAETIEKITKGSQDVPCESGTIRRIVLWWGVVMPYFLNVLKSLSEKYKMPHHLAPAFKKIVRAVANSGNWIFVGAICTRSVSLSG